MDGWIDRCHIIGYIFSTYGIHWIQQLWNITYMCIYIYMYACVAPRVRVHKGRETGTNQFLGLGVLPQKRKSPYRALHRDPLGPIWTCYTSRYLAAHSSSVLAFAPPCLEPCAVAMAKSVISPGSLQLAYGSYIQGCSIHMHVCIYIYVCVCVLIWLWIIVSVL